MESRKSYHTRSGRKEKKNWNSILISALVFLGVILVIWVGTDLFIKSFDQASNEDTYQNDSKAKADTDKSENDTTTTTDEEDTVVVDDSTTEDDTTNSDTEDSTTSEDETTTAQPANSGNWEPIGTEQSEPHVSSYKEGSVDWNEKIKAIEYATNVSADQMKLLWLGNNGDPDHSYAVITTPTEKNDPTVVYLEWVTEKGWKPTQVTKLSELSEEKQKEIKAKYQGDSAEADQTEEG